MFDVVVARSGRWTARDRVEWWMGDACELVLELFRSGYIYRAHGLLWGRTGYHAAATSCGGVGLGGPSHFPLRRGLTRIDMAWLLN